MKFLLFGLVISIGAATLRAAPTLVYSPDKRFVVAWDDADMGPPIGDIRSILLAELPHGDRPFSLVTYPRDTRVCWSPDSKKCLIINAPDDGNVQTWLFVAKDAGPQPNAIEIDPFKSLEKLFLRHGDLYRYNITKAAWADNRTLTLSAFDNNGVYKITVNIDSPSQPLIHKLITLNPGQGVGNIRLGQTREQIKHLLGTPDGGDAATGRYWDTWYTNSGPTREELTVRSDPAADGTHRVTEILVTSPELTTRSGISTSSGIQEIWNAYPDIQFTRFLNKQRNPAMEIYDDVTQGISFEILGAPRKNMEPVRKCCAIVIHGPGTEVFPMGTSVYPMDGDADSKKPWWGPQAK